MSYFIYRSLSDRYYLKGLDQDNANGINYILEGNEYNYEECLRNENAVLQGELRAYKFFADALLRKISNNKNPKE